MHVFIKAISIEFRLQFRHPQSVSSANYGGSFWFKIMISINKYMIYKGNFDQVSIAVQAYPVFKPSHSADQVMKCSVNFYELRLFGSF